MNRAFLASAAGFVIVLVMLAAAVPVAALAALAGRSGALSPPAWVLLAPLLYLGWLASFLRLSAAICHRLGARHPKPRYLVLGAGSSGSSDERGMLTVGVCFRLFALLHSTPFVSLFAQLPYFKTLVYRAYAPAVHIDDSAIVMGRVLDPDLTHIGPRAVVGGGSSVVAHSMAFRPTGERVFVSAPVTIGARATIGGESLVNLGCSIGDDAIVEPGSVVEAFTQIAPGEVWGGNPARFKRTRNDADSGTGGSAPGTSALPDASGPAADAPSARPAARLHAPDTAHLDAAAARRPAPPPGTSRTDVVELVARALELDPRGTPSDLRMDTCPRWDSLGQVAIAAAVFDRYGVTVPAKDVFRLKSLDDVQAAIEGRAPGDTATASATGSGAKADDAASPPGTRPVPQPVAQGEGSQRASAVDDVPFAVDDPEWLPLLDPQVATRLLATAGDQPDSVVRTSVRLLVTASFTAQSLEPPLRLWGRAFGYDIDCRLAGYDQILGTLLGPGDERRGTTLVLTRLEDLVTDGTGTDTTYMDQVLDAIAAAAGQRAPGDRILVSTLPPVTSSLTAPAIAGRDALRYRWRSRAESIKGVEILEFGAVVERIGAAHAADTHAELYARAPYAPRVFQELAIAIVRQLRSARGARAKVIALDCDNTLWGGVVGEVGLEGIELGRDGAGRSFHLFQQQLKRLKERGFLLVVASKNEEHDVRRVFEDHPEMVLRPDDIAAWRVNWRHKSDNLREMAQELNLGIDAFVFFDDDPVSRTEVKARVPAVHVVPMPQDPALYCETLQRLWLFDGAAATEVDAKRTQMAKEEQRRQEERGSAASLEAFLASLQLTVDLSEATEADLPRVAQLTQRTNQFNLSLKRRSLEEVQALASHAVIVGLRARDRFGDYGHVGVCVLEATTESDTWEIDTLLMSCRALGRGVEDALIHGIGLIAAERGATTLVAPFVEGPRNAQVKDYLARCGFTDTGTGVWRLPLRDLPALPPHVTFNRRMRSSAAAPAAPAMR